MKTMPKTTKKRRTTAPAHNEPQEATSAGQSGDTQGLSNVAEAGPQSVSELIEEGQPFEAEVISGVENAPDPDQAEVHTKQRPEDDLPPEYRGSDLEKDV